MGASFGGLRRFKIHGFFDSHGILPPMAPPRPSKTQFYDLLIPQYRSPPISEVSSRPIRRISRALRAAKGFETFLRPKVPDLRCAQRRRGGRPPRFSQVPKSLGTHGGLGAPIFRPSFGLPRGPDCSTSQISDRLRTFGRLGCRGALNFRESRHSQPPNTQSFQHSLFSQSARPPRASRHFELRAS